MNKVLLISLSVLLLFSFANAQEVEAIANMAQSQAIQAMLGPAPRASHGEYFTSEPFVFFRGVNGPAYGLDAFNSQFIKFWLNNPAATTLQGANTMDLYCGDFGPLNVFYAIDNATSNLVMVDTASGAATTIGAVAVQSGHTWTGMSWDATTSTMYAASTDGVTSALYTLDLNTPAATLVGTNSTMSLVIDIAIHPVSGQLYVHDLSDQIFLADKNNFSETLLGATGFDANFAQGMDFNPETAELYLAAYNNLNSSGELRLVDLNNGSAALIGPIGAGTNVEVCAFGILGATGDDLDPKPPENFSAYSDYSTPSSMMLNWTDPTEYVNGTPLTNFQIIIARDAVVIDSVAMGTETFTDAGPLNDGQVYTYDIWAKDGSDSTSISVTAAWTAGGAAQPDPPAAFSLVSAGGGDLMAHWTNPSTNVDGTPMDDFDAINLYENGSLLTTFTRSPGDTGSADSATFTPGGTNLPYYVTAVDNESPANESVPSGTAFPPFAAPYFQDFDGGVLPPLWTNETDDDFDWTINSGGTTSSGTGPTGDHTSGSGYYMYTETSSPIASGDVAHLTTPFIDLSTIANPGLAFWYHMHGAAMGELHVDVYANGQWNLDVMPPLIGQQQPAQTDPYLQAVVDLSNYAAAPVQVRFRGICGTSFTSDMAIDDVLLGPTAADPQMVVTPQTIDDTLLIGDMSTHNFTVSNAQPSPSVMNYTVTENPSVTWLSVSPTAGTLTSGQSDILSVTLDATGLTAGTYTTDLFVASNDPVNSQDTVAVTLVANDAPVIRIEPDSLFFTLGAGGQDSLPFWIHNDGVGPLQILSIEDEEATSRASFQPKWVQKQRPTIYYEKGEDPPANGGHMTDGAGGPDPFGYTWIDSDEPGGPSYVFMDISGTGTVVALQPTGTFDPKDEGMATLTLPFDVKLYGNNYNQVQVNSNGACTFDLSFFANMFTNVSIPSVDPPQLLVAPFWDDLDGSAGGDIYYQQNGNQFIIQWHNWGHYPAGTQNMIFQVVFFQNSSTIWFVYENIVDEAQSTFGIENGDGTIGLEIAFDQTYAHNQLLTKITLGAEWLNENPTSGIVASGDSLQVQAIVNSANLLGGDYLANVVVSSNDPVNPTMKKPAVKMTVTGQPNIVTTPDPLTFDTTFVNGFSTGTLTVTNNGSDVLNVTNVTSTNPVFSPDTTSFDVPAINSLDVTVTFSPTSAGSETGWLIVASNDPDTPLDSTWVQGVAVPEPVMIVDPGNLYMLMTPDSADTSINITNSGGSDLIWSASTSWAPATAMRPLATAGPVAPSLPQNTDFDAQATPQEPPAQDPTDDFGDLLTQYDLVSITGATSHLGCAYADGHFWVTSSEAGAPPNYLHKIDEAGNLVQSYSQPTSSWGWRDLAYDGTFLYASVTPAVEQIDPATGQPTGVQIPGPENPNRALAYDPATDHFWTVNFGGSLYEFDRAGNVINQFPNPVSSYGAAWDVYFDTAKPYIWLNAGTSTGDTHHMDQVDPVTGQLTGLTITGIATKIAGGLDMTTEMNMFSGLAVMIAVGQTDVLSVWEIAEAGVPWLAMNPTSGIIQPGDVATMDITAYWDNVNPDTAYIVLNTNAPSSPIVNVMVVRDTTITGIEDLLEIPMTYAISQNYPNPFNPTTTFKYQLPELTDVKLVVYNVLGQKVRTLINQPVDAGYHSVVWDGHNDAGNQVASGLYIYRFEAGDYAKTMKMMLLK